MAPIHPKYGPILRWIRTCSSLRASLSELRLTQEIQMSDPARFDRISGRRVGRRLLGQWSFASHPRRRDSASPTLPPRSLRSRVRRRTVGARWIYRAGLPGCSTAVGPESGKAKHVWVWHCGNEVRVHHRKEAIVPAWMRTNLDTVASRSLDNSPRLCNSTNTDVGLRDCISTPTRCTDRTVQGL